MTITLPIETKTRTLHLVDIENLVGDPFASKADALDALDRYLARAGYRDGDHVIIAANPGLIVEIGFDRPVPSNMHAIRGEDGADLMLIANAPPEWVAERFGRLVIGSGDAEFAPTSAAVRDLGVPVVIVAHPGSLSNTLQGQGFGIRMLPDSRTAVVLAA